MLFPPSHHLQQLTKIRQQRKRVVVSNAAKVKNQLQHEARITSPSSTSRVAYLLLLYCYGPHNLCRPQSMMMPRWLPKKMRAESQLDVTSALGGQTLVY
jgi:hypothetical protein